MLQVERLFCCPQGELDGPGSRTQKRSPLWTYYKGAKRDPVARRGSNHSGLPPGQGMALVHIPSSGDKVSVGIVAERDYLFNGSTKDHAEIFQREIKEQRMDRRTFICRGTACGEYQDNR